MDERLKKAKRFLAIAESKDAKREAYKAAAKEIAAYKTEYGDTYKHIAMCLGKSPNYVELLAKWHRSGHAAETPFLMDKNATSRAAASHTKKVLREAPLEQIEQIISDLPKDRQQAIAAAAGDRYAKVRQELDEKEARLSPADRKARDAVVESVGRTARGAARGFTALGIANHLEQATDALKEMISDDALTPELTAVIGRALDDFKTEFEVAQAMVGLEGGRI